MRPGFASRVLPALVALALLPGVAAAQPDIPTTGTPLADAGVTAVTTFIIGFIVLVFIGPFSKDVIERIQRDPLVELAYGIGVLVAFLVAYLGLFVTRIGIPVALVLLVVFIVVVLAGNVLALMALFSTLGLGEDLRLVGAALVAGALQLIPFLGPLIGFCVASVGAGAVVREFRSR